MCIKYIIPGKDKRIIDAILIRKETVFDFNLIDISKDAEKNEKKKIPTKKTIDDK